MKNRFTLIVIALIIAFVGIFWVTKHKASAPSTNVALSNHVKGDGKSGVTLTEYGDFECPACYSYEPLVEQVFTKYQHDITFQFRNYPLSEIHQHAMSGHRAAEAAAKQGKFWEMHDILYQRAHQITADGKTIDTEWTTTDNNQAFFDQYAKSIGLNLDQFHQDMKSEYVNSVIQADRNDAKARGFSGTPTFLINGKQIQSPNDLNSFYKLIDDAIAAAKK